MPFDPISYSAGGAAVAESPAKNESAASAFDPQKYAAVDTAVAVPFDPAAYGAAVPAVDPGTSTVQKETSLPITSAAPGKGVPTPAQDAAANIGVKPMHADPAERAAFVRQFANAGPLETLGLLLKNFSYKKSVEQSFEPSPDLPQLPQVAATGSVPAQIGKELYNTAAGLHTAALTPGAGSLMLNPLADAYALPYFLTQAVKSVPEAFRAFMDPDATAADRTRATASAALNALAVFGTGAAGRRAAGMVKDVARGRVEAGPAAAVMPQVEPNATEGGSAASAAPTESAPQSMTKTGKMGSSTNLPPNVGTDAGELAGNGAKAGTERMVAATALERAKAAAGNLWRSGRVREAMKYTRDAADTQADRLANVTANDIRGPLQRTFGSASPRAENALSFVVEALNNPEKLTEFQQQVEQSTAATPKWKQTALEALQFAQDNFSKLKPVAEKYSDVMHRQWEAEAAAGHDTPFRAGYVMHAQDIADPAGFETFGGGSDGSASAFKKMRVFDTFADSVSAGVDPKSLNAVDLMRSRLAAGQKLVNRSAWVDSLRDMADPTNKQPLITQPEAVGRPDGSTYMNAPKGYRVEIVGNRPVAIQEGYAGIFDALTKPSALSQETLGPMLQKINATGKSINLLLDTFHLGRLAMWNSVIKAAGVTTFKAPIPTFQQGLTLLDHSVPEITAMAKEGDVPQRWLPKVFENKRNLDLMINRGLNVGHVADAMHQEWVRKIPGIGTFNKFVFEQYQRGAMSEIALLEYERQRGMYPELSDAEVARQVARDVNTRFGNFGRQGLIRSKIGQDIARLVVLAPQWNEGLIKSEFGAVKQIGTAVKDAVVNQRLASGMLARGTATMLLGQFMANQLINFYTRGHPTWENPEEKLGAKLSAWVPDKIGGGPGFFLHPAALAAETTHLFMQKLERDPNWQKALASYARARESFLWGPIEILRTGKDKLLRQIKPDDMLKEFGLSMIPTPIASSAGAAAIKEGFTGQPSEVFPGQYQKQLMASVGVKADSAPSPEQRIARMANDYKDAHNIPRWQGDAGDFYALTNALRIGNVNDARAALDELQAKKRPDQMIEHYTRTIGETFTGSLAHEIQFQNGLNPEQKQTYQKAREDRLKLAQKAMKFIMQELGQKKGP